MRQLPPGVTYRQYDYWIRTGLLHATSDLPEHLVGVPDWSDGLPRTLARPGSGRHRDLLDDTEWQVLTIMGPLTTDGVFPHKAAAIARALIADGHATLAGYRLTPIVEEAKP